jgi:tetratricopeptide (TPR) repeat protein
MVQRDLPPPRLVTSSRRGDPGGRLQDAGGTATSAAGAACFNVRLHRLGRPDAARAAGRADGYALLARGDYAGALAGFREAAMVDPLLADPAHTLPQLAEGSAALRRGRPALARDRFQAARAAMPGSSEVHRLLGVAHWANRDFGMSVDELTEAVRLRPADERARIMLALVLVETGAHSKAEAVLSQTLEALPRSTLARLWLGSVYQSLNRHIEAAHSYEAAAPATLTGRPRLYAAIAQLHEGAANVAGAVDALSRGVGLNPNDAGALDALARGFAVLDRLDEAFAEHVAALLVDPESPDAYMGIGQLHLNAGRYAEAALVLQRLVSLQPASVEARYALANALQRSGKAEAGARELAEFQRLQTAQVEARRRTMRLG